MIPLPFQILLPVAVILITALVGFVGGRILDKPKWWCVSSLVGLIIAGAVLVSVSTRDLSVPWQQSIVPANSKTESGELSSGIEPTPPHAVDFTWDRLSVAMTWWSLGIAFCAILTVATPQQISCRAADWCVLALFSTAGLFLTGIANDLIGLFLAMELACLPLCILLWISGHDNSARWSPTSYLLMHIVSSALLLLGFSFACGLAGSTNLADMRIALLRHETSVEPQLAADGSLALGVAAMVLIVAGLGFRLSAVPFHFGWSEIVATTTSSTSAFLSVVPRLAAVAVFLRVLVVGMAGLEETGMLLALVAAGMTMAVGSALALRQTRLRPILAYTVMAQGGFALAALAVGFQDFARASQSSLPWSANPGGVSAALLVLSADTLATIGLYALLAYLARPGLEIEFPEQLSGLLKSQPLAAICAAVLLLSLVGLPPLWGFWGRLNVLMALMSTTGDVSGSLDAGPNIAFWLLALVASCALLTTSTVALRLLVRVCFDTQISRPRPGGGRGALATIVVAAALCLGCGFWPRPILNYLDDLQQALCQPRAASNNSHPAGGAGGGRRSTTSLENNLNSVAHSGKISPVGPGR